MTGPDNPTEILNTHWHAWQHAFNQRDIARMVALFADNALFQGLTPNLLVGAGAIAEYYANVPAGVSADVTPGKAIRISQDGVAGFASVRFPGAEGAPVRVARLSATLQRDAGQWRIALFHACETVSVAA